MAVFAGCPALPQNWERMSFAAGNNNAAVEASVTGDGYLEYVLGASAGQTMGVSMIADGSAYFNILPPRKPGRGDLHRIDGGE